MAVPTELGVSFTPEEIASMKDAAKTITNLIRSKKTLNLTNDERKNLSTISNDRLPYVQKSITEYGVSFPKLNGLGYDFTLADNDLNSYTDLFEVLTSIEEAVEVTTEMQMVAGHFSYKFMTDQYYTAKRYLGDNVDGAQIVYDGLKDCFEGQGPNNPTQGDDADDNSGGDDDTAQP